MRYLDHQALLRGARAHLLDDERPTAEEAAELLSARVATPVVAGWTSNGTVDYHGISLLPDVRRIVEAVVSLDEALGDLELDVDPDDFEGFSHRLEEPRLVVGTHDGGAEHLGVLTGVHSGRLDLLRRESYALTIDVTWDEEPMTRSLADVLEDLDARRDRAGHRSGVTSR